MDWVSERASGARLPRSEATGVLRGCEEDGSGSCGRDGTIRGAGAVGDDTAGAGGERGDAGDPGHSGLVVRSVDGAGDTGAAGDASGGADGGAREGAGGRGAAAAEPGAGLLQPAAVAAGPQGSGADVRGPHGSVGAGEGLLPPNAGLPPLPGCSHAALPLPPPQEPDRLPSPQRLLPPPPPLLPPPLQVPGENPQGPGPPTPPLPVPYAALAELLLFFSGPPLQAAQQKSKKSE